MKTKFIILIEAIIILFNVSYTKSASVLPGMGLSFHQLNLTYTGVEIPYSSHGLAIADINALKNSTGISFGYLNVVSSNGWVIKNLPVDTANKYGGLSVIFDLGASGPITDILVYADLSASPSVNFFGIPNTLFTVTSIDNNAQGSDSLRDSVGVNIDLSLINFNLDGLIDFNWQPFHPNIEQDDNQCYPAAVANSLQWLKIFKGLPVTHNHVPGIRNNTLVGQLDLAMERPAHQLTPSAVAFLRGKLKYLNNNNLVKGMSVKHKQRPGITWLNGNFTEGNVTSKENVDATSLVEWIISEVKKGEDVEVRIGWTGGGGHMFDIIGAGYILGVPWISWVHDAEQAFNGNDVSTNGGVSFSDGGVGFSFVTDNRIRCYMGGKTSPATIDFAASESYYKPVKINLSYFIEGIYQGAANVQTPDTIRAFLRKSTAPFEAVDSSKVLCSNNGLANLEFSTTPSGSYYLMVNHRNTIETWSALPLTLNDGDSLNYSFATSTSQAYGNNLKQIDTSPLRFGAYSGDVNQDGTIDVLDLFLTDNDAFNFVTGYVNTDVNGNNLVDGIDLAIIDNNAFNFVSKITPQ